MMAALAEFEKDLLRERIHWGLRPSKREGRFWGQLTKRNSGSSEGRVHQIRTPGPTGAGDVGSGAVVPGDCEGTEVEQEHGDGDCASPSQRSVIVRDRRHRNYRDQRQVE